MHGYNTTPAGRYLTARFGFTFIDSTEGTTLDKAQIALWSDAREVERIRRVYRRTAAEQIEDLKELAEQFIETTTISAPIQTQPRVDLFATARKIEDAEFSLGRWVDVVRKLQEDAQ